MKEDTLKIICRNRKALFEYAIDALYEAGLVLTGTEVKSLRQGKASINDAYARFKDGEIYLYNAHISPYSHAAVDSHNPERPRKLLLNRWELKRLLGKTQERGFTPVMSDRGMVVESHGSKPVSCTQGSYRPAAAPWLCCLASARAKASARRFDMARVVYASNALQSVFGSKALGEVSSVCNQASISGTPFAGGRSVLLYATTRPARVAPAMPITLLSS